MDTAEHKGRVITQVLKPSWYVHQMKGWSRNSYFLLLFGLGFILATTLSGELNTLTFFTMAAGMLGFTCTISITNTKPLNGVFGLISALIYIVVAFQAKNYNDMLLQTVYIILLDIPVLLIPQWSQDVDKKVRGLGTKGYLKRNWALVIAFLVVVVGLLYVWESGFTDSPRPFVDSIAAGVGITGALLTTLRFKESYYFWLLSGLTSVALWFVTFRDGGNPILFFTYILYLCNDGVAFLDKDVAWFHKKEEKLS